RSAAFVRQTVPLRIMQGTSATVQVTMRNTGSATWTNTGTNAFKLGSQNPQDNQTWGLSRVPLPVAAVPPGAEVTFVFDIQAPIKAGTYNLQWKMLQEFVEWFGDLTTNVPVRVTRESTS